MIRIILISLLLGGCGITGAIRVKTDLSCYWAEEIRFEEETKAWLADLDWPESFERDMEKIGDHNILFTQYCPE